MVADFTSLLLEMLSLSFRIELVATSRLDCCHTNWSCLQFMHDCSSLQITNSHGDNFPESLDCQFDWSPQRLE